MPGKKRTSAASRAPRLTRKQQVFVREYLVDLNATQAAIRAGYSAKTAQQISTENLSKPLIRAAIDQAMAERSGRVEIAADRVLREIANLAFSDIGQVLDFAGDVPRLKPAGQIPEAARRAIAGVKVRRYREGKGEDAQDVEIIEFKLWPKDAALRDLGRHLKLFTDKTEVTVPHLEAAIEAELARLAAGSQAPVPGTPPADPDAATGAGPMAPASGTADPGL